MTDFKPCPFCGNNNVEIVVSFERDKRNKYSDMYCFSHLCNKIIINSTWVHTKEELVEIWNNRKED